MPVFAKVDGSNTVQDVTVVSEHDAHRGAEFLSEDLGLGGRWLQASEHTRWGIYFSQKSGLPHSDQSLAFRGNYPLIDSYSWNDAVDGFIPPQPEGEFVLSQTNFCWVPAEGAPSDVAWFPTDDGTWTTAPKPFDSWILQTFGDVRLWMPPVEFPEDTEVDVFWFEDLGCWAPEQPYPSWVFNFETLLWEPPVPMPEVGGPWVWDEEALKWVEQS